MGKRDFLHLHLGKIHDLPTRNGMCKLPATEIEMCKNFTPQTFKGGGRACQCKNTAGQIYKNSEPQMY